MEFKSAQHLQPFFDKRLDREMTIRKATGSYAEQEAKGKRQRLNPGKIFRKMYIIPNYSLVIIMGNGITDGNQAEEALREARQAMQENKAQFEQFASMISDILWRYDVIAQSQKNDGVYISPVADRMLGLPEPSETASKNTFPMFILTTCKLCRRCFPTV